MPKKSKPISTPEKAPAVATCESCGDDFDSIQAAMDHRYNQVPEHIIKAVSQ